MLLRPVKNLVVLCVATGITSGQQCNTDGSQYSYSETVSAGTRTITESGCPSHKWTNINPNYPVARTSTWRVPSEPMYEPAAEISLSAQGGATGILFSATQVRLPRIHTSNHIAVAIPEATAQNPACSALMYGNRFTLLLVGHGLARRRHTKAVHHSMKAIRSTSVGVTRPQPRRPATMFTCRPRAY